jgi:hypothetical protein
MLFPPFDFAAPTTLAVHAVQAVQAASAHVAGPATELLAAGSGPAVLLAKVQDTVLVRSFLIAVIVVAPVWVLVRKRVRSAQERSSTSGTDDSLDDTDPSAPAPLPRLEDVIAAIPDVAAAARDRGSATITVPSEVTVDGRPTESAVVDALVRDSLRRSGLVAVAEVDSPAGRSLELRAVGTSDHGT